jgi:hypothetical protein
MDVIGGDAFLPHIFLGLRGSLQVEAREAVLRLPVYGRPFDIGIRLIYSELLYFLRVQATEYFLEHCDFGVAPHETIGVSFSGWSSEGCTRWAPGRE